ncbi:hypothetical protein TSA6c_28105 [Azospirillum sp. TSA6c]|nr:hypothetical protein TSA6c_28105 [Azospirillum sp. TSA6c]
MLGRGTRLWRNRIAIQQSGKAAVAGIDRIDRIADRDAGQRPCCGGVPDGIGRHVLIEQGERLGIGQAVIQLVRLHPPVQRHHGDAGQLAGPMDGRHLPIVLQRGGDAVAGAQGQPVEGADQPADALQPLRVGQPQVAVDDGERVRAALRAGQDAAAEVKHGRSPSPSGR